MGEIEATPTRILVVDDHHVMGHALVMALRLQGFESVEAVGGDDVDETIVLDTASQAGPGSIVVLDLHLGADRVSTPLIAPLWERGSRVLVLTAEQDSELLGECLEAGADGVFDKSQPFDQLVGLLHDAARGESVMTARARQELLDGLRSARADERERRQPFELLTSKEAAVLRALLDGAGVDAIAREQVVATSTIRSHVKAILRKLGVNSQLAAVALARDAGWPHTRD